MCVARVKARRRQSLRRLLYADFRSVYAFASGVLLSVGGLVWAIVRGSWADFGYAVLGLAIAVGFGGFLWSTQLAEEQLPDPAEARSIRRNTAIICIGMVIALAILALVAAVIG